MVSARTARLARRLRADLQQAPGQPARGQADPRFEQFASGLKQEAAKWQQYEMQTILQALNTYAQEAGFSAPEIRKIQQNFQQVAAQENMQTAIQVILNSPDIMYHHSMV